MKVLILSLLLSVPLIKVSASDCPGVRLSVVKQEECQKCAMLVSETPLVDGYRVVLRLVNESAKPVVVYGFRHDTGFDPAGYILEQSKDTCKWKYPNGDEVAPAWSGKSVLEKDEHSLAAGESLEIEATFNRFHFDRWFKRTVFVAPESGGKPCEIASDEFTVSDDKTQGSARQPLGPCQPNCTLTAAQVPAPHGLKLGMSVDEVLAVYPDFEVKPVDEFGVRWASLYLGSDSALKTLLPDVFSVNLHFLKDRLAQVEISYWALDKSKSEFQTEEIRMLGLTGAWQAGREVFECENFEIQILNSPLPEIFITDKAAKTVLARRVEASYAKPKERK